MKRALGSPQRQPPAVMSEGPAFLLKMAPEWEREGDGRGLTVVLISWLTAPLPLVFGVASCPILGHSRERTLFVQV